MYLLYCSSFRLAVSRLYNAPLGTKSISPLVDTGVKPTWSDATDGSAAPAEVLCMDQLSSARRERSWEYHHQLGEQFAGVVHCWARNHVRCCDIAADLLWGWATLTSIDRPSNRRIHRPTRPRGSKEVNPESRLEPGDLKRWKRYRERL